MSYKIVLDFSLKIWYSKDIGAKERKRYIREGKEVVEQSEISLKGYRALRQGRMKVYKNKP
jgi:hypothetical protein